MSDAEEEPSAAKRVYRTVKPPWVGHSASDMSAIGWAIFLGMLVLIVPLLPFIVIAWLLGILIDRLTGRLPPSA